MGAPIAAVPGDPPRSYRRVFTHPPQLITLLMHSGTSMLRGGKRGREGRKRAESTAMLAGPT